MHTTPSRRNKLEPIVQFPIGLLSYPKLCPDQVPDHYVPALVAAIKAYSVWTFSSQIEHFSCDRDDAGTYRDPGAASEAWMRMLDKHENLWKSYADENADDDYWNAKAVWVAAEMLHVSLDTVLRFGTNFYAFRASMTPLQKAVEESGSTRFARIRHSIMDDVADGEFTWRQFSVLAAIYASLDGRARDATKLFYDQLAAMASGYSGHRMAAKKGIPADRFLSKKQMRSTVEQLWQRNLFAKVPAYRGFWVSTRMQESALVEYAAKAEVYRKSAASVKAQLRAKINQIEHQAKGSD